MSHGECRECASTLTSVTSARGICGRCGELAVLHAEVELPRPIVEAAVGWLAAFVSTSTTPAVSRSELLKAQLKLAEALFAWKKAVSQ